MKVQMKVQMLLILSACVLVAALPLRPASNTAPSPAPAFPGWPTVFEGQPLTSLPLTAREDRFARGFPGRIGRFTDGRREIILRWVTQETRRLHPAIDCFRGLGYHITPAPLYVDDQGHHWSQFTATRGHETLRVREYVSGGTQSWPDVSAWYWQALLGRTAGPWWTVTVAERG